MFPAVKYSILAFKLLIIDSFKVCKNFRKCQIVCVWRTAGIFYRLFALQNHQGRGEHTFSFDFQVAAYELNNKCNGTNIPSQVVP